MSVAPAWRVRDILPAAALFLATAAFTLYQNARVAALWDLSYLLDTSFRISLHQLPYRDFPFAHAPLTFLLHARIIRIFGRVYLPHILCAALEAGLATLLTWRILLRLLKPLADRAFLIATLLASPLIFLGIYGIYPHPIYDSDCILAVLRPSISSSAPGIRRTRNLLAGAACVLPALLQAEHRPSLPPHHSRRHRGPCSRPPTATRQPRPAALAPHRRTYRARRSRCSSSTSPSACTTTSPEPLPSPLSAVFPASASSSPSTASPRSSGPSPPPSSPSPCCAATSGCPIHRSLIATGGK